MFSNILSIFSRKDKHKTAIHEKNQINICDNIISPPDITPEDESKILDIYKSCSLDFFAINNYGQELVKETAIVFDDSFIKSQSKLANESTTKVEEILVSLTQMDTKKIDMLRIKEINLLSHYYKQSLYNHLVLIKSKQTTGDSIFKQYDLFLEAGKRFVIEAEKSIIDSNDPFEQHKTNETRKNLHRFQDRLVKLQNSKLYHLQSLTQMTVLSGLMEKIYDQVNEIIFIVIPVLKSSDSINLSMQQMDKIRSNIAIIRQDKNLTSSL